MNDFRYGPVEFYLVGFEGEGPDPETFQALRDLLASGAVRLLDFVLLTKTAGGDVETRDLDVDQADLLGEAHPLADGLAGEEDIMTLAQHVPAGTSAAVVVLELAFARTLAAKLQASGGEVLRTERVPAPVVNAMIDILEQEGE
ncbi:DUF6325 family protein [Microbacterium sp. 2216-1]|uniref:DUF6325 family protein n=1 Tax=Microbacterium TaxID=33882 RepID=UPI0015CE5B8D|nr:DUF6325 family protein [Microbacterium esteraromaticum]MBN7792467.1 hypothetical protein [Microbacterium esteraromaticum]MBN8423234.1 hypothetical protein [Microbacterium esteraromaticum]MCA1306422.1 DUF6325 family protein [Microbacterium esteraromaticum]